MKLDMVHDLQAVYRKLLDSTSRPGLISNMSKEAVAIKIDKKMGMPNNVLLLALTLLDSEVSFKVYSAQESDMTKKINQLTYAKAVEVDQADYIFVLQDAKVGSLEEAIVKGKSGTLRNPHKSATIIAGVPFISNGNTYVLRGPGIQTTSSNHVEVTGSWLEVRQAKNIEFPLGIDLIFVDEQDQLLSLPRTTQITKNRVIV